MITEQQYRRAKRIVYVSKAVLLLNCLLILFTVYHLLVEKKYHHSLTTAIINFALFLPLFKQNKKIVEEYEQS